MSDLQDDNTELEEGEETTKPKAKKERSTKIDPVGLSYYGQEFKHFNRVGELVGLLPQFKEFYYTTRIKDPKASIPDMMKAFNKTYAYPDGLTFYPYITQLRSWRTKWDRDILAKKMEMKEEDVALVPAREVRQLIKTRQDGNVVLGAPADEDLEAGVRTLGGELLNDALQMLKDDQELEEMYDGETLIKRRNYVLNVLSHTTRLVHGKQALLLKASQEKRENANFLMNLLAKASAGKMSDDEVEMLETTYTQPHEQPAHV